MHKDWFRELRSSSIKDITTANNSKMAVAGVGDIELKLQNGNDVRVVDVKEVLYIPDLTANLLSVNCITKNKNSVEFVQNECRIYDSDGMMLSSASLINNVYKLNGSHIPMLSLIATENICDVNIWHRRFGHVNISDLLKMKNGAVNGLRFKSDDTLHNCESCYKGKQSRKPFNNVGS